MQCAHNHHTHIVVSMGCSRKACSKWSVKQKVNSSKHVFTLTSGKHLLHLLQSCGMVNNVLIWLTLNEKHTQKNTIIHIYSAIINDSIEFTEFSKHQCCDNDPLHNSPLDFEHTAEYTETPQPAQLYQPGCWFFKESEWYAGLYRDRDERLAEKRQHTSREYTQSELSGCFSLASHLRLKTGMEGKERIEGFTSGSVLLCVSPAAWKQVPVEPLS